MRRLMIVAAAGVAFVLLWILVATGWPPLAHADSSISEALRRYGTANATTIRALRVATDVMATAPFVTAGAVVAGGLAYRRAWAAASTVAAVVAAIPLVWSLFHHLLHRPRPVDGFVAITSNGFPSGHSAHAAGAAGLAVVLLWTRLGRAGRAALATGAAAFALFIGATRVALLAHWPSDVVGGWLLGAVAVAGCSALARPRASTLAAGSDLAADDVRDAGQPDGDHDEHAGVE